MEGWKYTHPYYGGRFYVRAMCDPNPRLFIDMPKVNTDDFQSMEISRVPYRMTAYVDISPEGEFRPQPSTSDPYGRHAIYLCRTVRRNYHEKDYSPAAMEVARKIAVDIAYAFHKKNPKWQYPAWHVYYCSQIDKLKAKIEEAELKVIAARQELYDWENKEFTEREIING